MTTARHLADDLDLAMRLADAADALTLSRFETATIDVGWKDDRTEVTEVDRSVERTLAAIVTADRPDDGFFGEEYGEHGNSSARWKWVIDPIDGTSGFARGIPIWASLVALCDTFGGALDPVVSVVSAPALHRRWWATAGAGAFANGRQIQVSGVASIADAQINVTLNDGWANLGATGALAELMVQAHRARGVGDFWQHCLVAEGAMDGAVDAIGVAPYDLAAVKLIVTEAGGRFTDRLGTDRIDSGSAVSSNALLHDELVQRIAASPATPQMTDGDSGS